MQNLSSDTVSRIEYDEKEQECIAKEEQIQVSFLIYLLNYYFILLDFTSENSSYGTFTSFKRYSSR
jgi:hypothetical protein